MKRRGGVIFGNRYSRFEEGKADATAIHKVAGVFRGTGVRVGEGKSLGNEKGFVGFPPKKKFNYRKVTTRCANSS